MKYIVLKYLNLTVLIAFVAWFLWPINSSWGFEWEPLIGFVLALISFIGIDVKEHKFQSGNNNLHTPVVSRADLDFFNELSRLFPSSDISFFRDHDFYNAFDPGFMTNIFNYVDHWTTAEHEFIDPELERRHELFREKAIALAIGLAEYTSPNRNGHASVAPSGHQGGPLPDWALEEAQTLNRLAKDFAESHQEFFRHVRSHFHNAGVL